jgi:hypothetical protein
VANALNNLGTIYMQNNSLEEALKYFSLSLEIKRSVFG